MNDKEFRDLAALLAMQSLIESLILDGRANIAEQAFKMADAMLTERKSRGTN